MDYRDFKNGTIVSCKVKCTYVELYAYNGSDYEFIFSVQKKYGKELGLLEVNSIPENGLINIHITDDLANYIIEKTKRNIRIHDLLKRNKNILYCKPVSLDCTEETSDDVVIEEVEVEDFEKKDKKDYSKLILIALAAAAATMM